MQHPPINPEFQPNPSYEREFMERAYEILGNYCVSCVEMGNGYSVEYPVTDRTDLVADDNSTLHALRLRRRQTFAVMVGTPAVVGGPMSHEFISEDYMVLDLQYGTLPEDEVDESDLMIDEDFHWSSYVLAIMDVWNEEVTILDGTTGQELSAADLVQARYALEILGSDLRNALFQTALEEDDKTAIAYHRQQGSYRQFDPATVDLNFECDHMGCGAVNTVCEHNKSKLN